VKLEITGILPTYNRAGLISRAVQSMLDQTSPLTELIVVDDGSRDETRDVVEKYGGRVRYIYQENRGGGAARNRGVAAARTPWVAFLDSDDLWTPDHLSRIERAVLRTSGRAELYFDDTSHRDGGQSVSRWALAGFVIEGEYSFVEDGTAWMMLHRQPVMLQSSVVKRSRFLELGGFWEELRTAHDTHFFLRLGIGRPVCAVAGVGAIQTEDDSPFNRLTVRSGRVKLGRWINTARLFKDIIDRNPLLAPEHRVVLCRRICDARWRTSRAYWENGDRAAALVEAWKSFRAAPRSFTTRVLREGPKAWSRSEATTGLEE
jgi:glycosyltransferase involved in cell wall biosynthesis